MKTKIVISVLAAIGLYTTFEFIYNIVANYFTAFPAQFGILDTILYIIIQLMVASSIFMAITEVNRADRK